MDGITMIKERRSVRKFKSEIVDEKTMQEIVDTAKFAPSWKNFQSVNYTFVTNAEIIAKIAELGVNGFTYNTKTLKNAPSIAVLSYTSGSGKMNVEDEGYVTSKASEWEMFDAGIACQTFCLSAWEKNVGTCIMGIIDDEAIAKLVGLPENEKVAVLIAYGYPQEGEIKAPPRKETSDIMRFVK